MMRSLLIISYFALLIVFLFGINSLVAQEVYERDGKKYNQHVFGFRMEVPEDWKIIDDGTISLNGDYLITFGPDLDEGSRIYFSFLPIKGLTLQEFATDSIPDMLIFDNINFDNVKIGNLKCIVYRQSLSGIDSEKFPDLTSLFARIGDHYLRAFFFSESKSQRDEVLDILKTIKYDKKLQKLSFAAVKNHANYGSQTSVVPIDEMYMFGRDPNMPADIELADGTESIIIDDFEYATRFPAGKHQDEYGFRIQYCVDGRYHIDNREKSVDVFVPDMQINARDFILKVDMRFEGGNPEKGNGLVFRGGESGFYLLDLTPDCHYAVFNYSSGFRSIVKKTHTKHALTFDTNRIEISVNDKQLKVSINDNIVQSVELGDDHDSGYVGLYVSSGSWVSFENYYLEIIS